MISLLRRAVLFLAVPIVSGPAATAAAPPRAFVGARLWDGTGRAPVDRAVIVVEGGRVSAVGADVAVPKGATVVDLAGAYVIPGLVNAHGHVGETRGLRAGPDLYSRDNVLAQLGLYARYGITTVVSLGGDQEAGFRVRDEQDTDTLARARLYVAGRVVDATTPEAARAQVEALAAQKPDWVKIRVDDNLGTTPKMTPEVYRAVVDAAHRRGLRVAAHLFYLDDARGLLDAGVDYLAHSVRDADVPADFAAALAKRGIPLCPTLMREVSAFVYADEPPFFSDPFFLKDADPAVVADLRGAERRQGIQKSPAAARYREGLKVASRNLKALFAAGVPIVMGTDTGPPARFQGYFEHEELRLMVEAGLTPAEVLFAATGGAARALGLPGVGRLEPGTWADFLILEADPLADIRNTRRIRAVYIAGNRVSDAKAGASAGGGREAAILRAIHEQSSPAKDAVFRVSDTLGRGWFLVPLVLLAAGWNVRHGRPAESRLWILLGLFTYALQEGLKAAVARPRPSLWPSLIEVTGFSFPSGHALAAATLFPLLARDYERRTGQRSLAARAVSVMAAVYVGVGRLYLGVHWPTDVLAGWALGAAQAAFCLRLLDRSGPAHEPGASPSAPPAS